MVDVVVGLQYGDEGKGRVTHYLAENANLVMRGTGGNNAGHTVVVNGKKYAMHLLPSSIIKDVNSVLAPGMVIDLKVINEEINKMNEDNIMVKDRLIISDKAHIILPHYIHLDKIYESFKENPVGTTGRGIGPAYEHKARRTGIRMGDLFLDDESLMKLIDENIKPYKYLIEATKREESITSYDILKYLRGYGNSLLPCIKNIQGMVNKCLENNQKILIEGAQATFLDIDHGDYPMVTSSSPVAGGAVNACGIGPVFVNDVIGVMKAYTSRVGSGPFMTEQDNEIGNKIRELGHEYGTTTKRPRRCGWLDLVQIKHAKYVNGLTHLCVNHIDTIGKFEEIKVCVAYKNKITGVITENYLSKKHSDYEPVYQTFPGSWSTSGCATFEDLPENAKNYLEFISEFVGVKLHTIGIGADEKETIRINGVEKTKNNEEKIKLRKLVCRY